MTEDESGEQPQPKKENPGEAIPAPRRPALTPEQRRFLNTPRSAATPPAAAKEPAARQQVKREPGLRRSEPAAEKSDPPDSERGRPAATPILQGEKASRTIELQHAILILGAILLLALTFYGGTKFNYVKYLLASRHQAPLIEAAADRFPGIAPEDLVTQALVAERAGHWQDAVERFMTAKRKDLHYRGILFRVGKILFDHREFDDADKAFERATAFGEDLGTASFYRGLIATRRRELPGAERFFEAATTAAPFVADYYYYSGEALRLDLKPKPARPCYERAALLGRSEQDEAVCQFKIRMARIEAAEGDAVRAELAKQEAAGPLPVDWLMTAAALQLREGHVAEAGQLIGQARAAKSPGLFASCVNDFYFHDAAEKNPDLAEALHLDLDLQAPFPN